MAMGSHEEPEEGSRALPLVRLNHVSFQCDSVEASVDFYQRVLGFELVKRPASLDFRGAWYAERPCRTVPTLLADGILGC